MTPLAGQRILLGVTGGIAAYKAAVLVRELRTAGAEVQVVMTAAARAFVAPLTFQALSGRPVRGALLDPVEESGMDHIGLARWADLVLVAPATADFLARLATGLADDLLATLCLATTAPIAVAPAMNHRMWEAPATCANVETLRRRGVQVLGPAEGDQACGETGPGRMIEPEAIAAWAAGRHSPGPLAGLKVLVTAGPTREPVDPVRFLSNRSSGKMGYAVAAAAAAAGARVVLVSGPVALATPEGIERVAVETAEEMLRAVQAQVADADVLVAAAAVADYRPAGPSPSKLKRTAAPVTLALEPTPDVLGWVAGQARRPFLVGFAAETENLETNALGKLRSKRLDLVAGNRVGVPGTGFDADQNELEVYWEGGSRRLDRAPKAALGQALIALIAERLHAKGRP
ncbi:MAG: bifunctional phosphopantothenoylcysteine decarboxylase/phosphopantothenate--cysteine ligase CoaBC [Gammaproteobacteria bacterium]|jgi:phosphopantothenoylcysteine decarboxylase/phosphopantothenate--cysteine ligase|nr:bifunctional phosphopantothenoylcysteine decarboxylase/phosphopantothenate--cysteine ligase CoaBC [Gammaproteobacteria bacterium]